MAVRRPVRALAAAAAAIALLAGCGSDDGLPAAGGDLGYVQGDGTWVETPPEARSVVVEFSGTGIDGETIDLADLRGDVVVLNTWFADCAPCREEAPTLEAVAQEYADRGVRVVGINTRDTAARARAFTERFGVTFPSVLDEDGSAMLALRGVAPRATPTTVVLDAQGRVAGQVSGVAERSILTGLVDGALGDGPGAGGEPEGAPA
ncbi:TlpA disulfide reductase family protein [Kineococcus terrestris]|uniref:TlpA disulfide reductase family protein n=1 Tax=Kineococcus terrestris TaxID=2044856 RepID=UPI0034DB0BAC